MPLILLYVIAITLICFISIVFTEIYQTTPPQSKHDLENQLSANPIMDTEAYKYQNRKDLVGQSSSVHRAPRSEEKEVAETYHYF